MASKKNSIIILIVLFTAMATIILMLRGTFSSNNSNQEVSDDFKSQIESKFDDPEIRKQDSIKQLQELYDKLNFYANDEIAKQFISSDRVNILITGVDSRLNTKYRHADANHIISIDFENKRYDIVAIPRDTPTEFFRLDTLQDTNTVVNVNTLNTLLTDTLFSENDTFPLTYIDTVYMKLTECRPIRGRKTYFDQLEKITGIGKIDYWVEFGFSQAMGLLEFFGFQDSKASLQVLRSRKKYNTGDFQRVYNQAKFMSQMMSSHFNKLDGLTGSIILRGALSLVETNISFSEAKQLLAKIKKKNMLPNKNNMEITVKPTKLKTFINYDFTNKTTFDSLKNSINEYSQNHVHKHDSNISVNIETKVTRKLFRFIAKAIRDSSKSPVYVIRDLKTVFKQHAWLQISNPILRDSIRSQMGILLIDAYDKQGKPKKSDNIRYAIEAEKALLDQRTIDIEQTIEVDTLIENETYFENQLNI